MKQPFRYFRGEFNGAYLYALVACPNYAVQDLVDELVYQTLFQWKLDDEVEQGELPVRETDIINIAKIAGLFQIRSAGRVSLGSTYFTQSHKVRGQERSERGLMDMQSEGFRFVRTEQDEYSDDIVKEASRELRMGFVPEGTPPVGYLPYGLPLYSDDGTVLWENLLDSPPDDIPYTVFYGEQFLVHEEFFNLETPLPIAIFKLLLECVQRIRYNGPSVAAFLDITRILGAGYIHDIEIVPAGRFYTVYYRINDEHPVPDKDRRFAAWQHICRQKFKLFAMENRA